MSPLRLVLPLVEPLRQAVATIAARPLRSALGALAIAVAVATLTLVETALDGLTLYARKNASRAFGSDTFVLAQVASPGQISRRELARKLERNLPIRRSDVRFLEAWAGDRVIYAATAQRVGDVIAGGAKFENAAVNGTGALLPAIRDLGIEQGRFFTPDEERRGVQVAVLGADIAEKLFPGRDPLDRTVRMGGRGFTVIGVQGRLGTSGGVSLDRYIWMPLIAYERTYGAAATLQVSARPPEAAAGSVAFDLAQDRARATLRARRLLAPGEEDNFDILTPDSARSFVLNLARRIGAVAPLLSGMALLAAIVVVTNTTLVSVAQRTFDIGVRRAVGATRGQIVREVLCESALVALTGGLLGTLAIAGLTRALSGPLGLELTVEPRTVLAALLASAGSGLLAGWYPARRAAQINIISALRLD
jgi:putative ABC transport system permease protein